jgi:hypothetical protein
MKTTDEILNLFESVNLNFKKQEELRRSKKQEMDTKVALCFERIIHPKLSEIAHEVTCKAHWCQVYRFYNSHPKRELKVAQCISMNAIRRTDRSEKLSQAETLIPFLIFYALPDSTEILVDMNIRPTEICPVLEPISPFQANYGIADHVTFIANEFLEKVLIGRESFESDFNKEYPVV